ncbi:MAG TPA: NINE protein [Saprospiraceae bacterium]|nr:NINE protein [Saprospiraceae bacterium]
MRSNYSNSQEKNKILAGILAFFLGGFGIHKFYLGKTGSGIFYLIIFFMTSRFFPVSFILGWIDAVRLITMSEEAFNRKYNKFLFEENQMEPRTIRRSERPVRREERKPARRPAGRQSQRTLPRSNPFKRSGQKKYQEFDLNGAIEDYVRALEISPRDHEVHYDLACSYSLLEEKEKSFYHLSQAVSNGLKPLEKIMTEDNLAYLRIQHEFEDFRKNGFSLNQLPAEVREEVVQTLREEDIQDDVLLSQLNKLAELRKKGLLTEPEFQLERKKLLRR